MKCFQCFGDIYRRKCHDFPTKLLKLEKSVLICEHFVIKFDEFKAYSPEIVFLKKFQCLPPMKCECDSHREGTDIWHQLIVYIWGQTMEVKDQKFYGNDFNNKCHRNAYNLETKIFENERQLTSEYRNTFFTIASKLTDLKSLSLNFECFPLRQNIFNLVTNSCNSDLKCFRCYSLSILITFEEVNKFCNTFKNIEDFQLSTRYRLEITKKSIALMIKLWRKLFAKIFRLELTPIIKERKYLYNGKCFRKISKTIEEINTSALIFDEFAVNYLLKSGANRLKSLNIKSIENYGLLKPLTECCPKLSDLSLYFDKYFIKSHNLLDLWSTLGQFESLSKLVIQLKRSEICNKCIKHLKKCSKLTDLEIYSRFMTSEGVAAIPQYIPQLKRLRLEIRTACEESLAPISRLKHLEYLNLNVSPDVKEQTFTDIIVKCVPLSFVVNYSKRLTSFTVVVIIEKAKTKAKTHFYLCVNSELKKFAEDFNDLIPKNLSI